MEGFGEGRDSSAFAQSLRRDLIRVSEPSRRSAPVSCARTRMAVREGFEPSVELLRSYNGLANRRLQPLGHLTARLQVYVKQELVQTVLTIGAGFSVRCRLDFGPKTVKCGGLQRRGCLTSRCQELLIIFCKSPPVPMIVQDIVQQVVGRTSAVCIDGGFRYGPGHAC